MTQRSNDVFMRIAKELEDERNVRAEMAWRVEPKPIDPDIEAAARRQTPRGHVAYLGNTALEPFKPEY